MESRPKFLSQIFRTLAMCYRADRNEECRLNYLMSFCLDAVLLSSLQHFWHLKHRAINKNVMSKFRFNNQLTEKFGVLK